MGRGRSLCAVTIHRLFTFHTRRVAKVERNPSKKRVRDGWKLVAGVRKGLKDKADLATAEHLLVRVIHELFY